MTRVRRWWIAGVALALLVVVTLGRRRAVPLAAAAGARAAGVDPLRAARRTSGTGRAGRGARTRGAGRRPRPRAAPQDRGCRPPAAGAHRALHDCRARPGHPAQADPREFGDARPARDLPAEASARPDPRRHETGLQSRGVRAPSRAARPVAGGDRHAAVDRRDAGDRVEQARSAATHVRDPRPGAHRRGLRPAGPLHRAAHQSQADGPDHRHRAVRSLGGRPAVGEPHQRLVRVRARRPGHHQGHRRHAGIEGRLCRRARSDRRQRATSTTPDFSLDIGGTPLPLSTAFVALVDGTNGDTILHDVDARLASTPIKAKGGIRPHAGPEGPHRRPAGHHRQGAVARRASPGARRQGAVHEWPPVAALHAQPAPGGPPRRRSPGA